MKPGKLPIQSGFSVLELIVALTLSMVLMAAIWTMFNLFARRELVDRARLDRLQLVRGFQQTLTADLARMVPQGDGGPAPILTGPGDLDPIVFVPPTSRKSDRSPRVPQEAGIQNLVSLRGTRDRLQIQVFEAPGAFTTGQSDDSVGDSKERFDEAPTHSAIASVSYEWRDFEVEVLGTDQDSFDNEVIAKDSSERQGLYRKEFIGRVKSRTSGDRLNWGLADRRPKLASGQEPSRDSDLVMADEHAPEFVRMEFGYFDGQAWRDSWDSGLAKQFPQAVRVKFDLESNLKKRQDMAEEWSAQDRVRGPSSSIKPREAVSMPDERDPLLLRFDYEFVVSIQRGQRANRETTAAAQPQSDPARRPRRSQ